jgi:long-chain acyl-CoA synthetase
MPYDSRLCLCTAVLAIIPGTIRSAEQVRAWLNEKVAAYKVPGRTIFDDQLPWEDSGKMMKRKIRDSCWQTSDRKIG